MLYIRHVHEDSRYENGKPHWVEVSRVRKNTLAHGAAWQPEKSVSGTEGRLRNRRERDRLRRQMETAEEQEAKVY